MMDVLAPGLLSSLQDGGRAGYARLGVGRSGAADWPAWRLGNALVGNRPDACAIEMTLRGPRLRLRRDATIALTGAPLPQARCNGRPLPMWQAVRCAAGSELDLGGMAAGCRSYLAVGGGIALPPWLGSRATDVNAGLGPLPRPLRAGDRLPLGAEPAATPSRPLRWSLDPRPWFDPRPPTLRLLPASHGDRLDARSRERLATETFRVAPDSNRVGVRLQGPPLALQAPLELVSEGVVPGVMQLPPGGAPILLLAEHPVTGGYPRIAQLAAVDLPRLAQCPPGATVRFAWTTIEAARAASDRQRRRLNALLGAVAERLGERRDARD